MKTYLNLFLIGTISFLSACSNDESNIIESGGNEVAFLCSYAGNTRATDTTFEDKDCIGVYIVADNKSLQLGGNELNNEPFNFNGSSWTASRKVFWNEGNHTVYAYYPYMKSVNDTEDFSFTLSEDQSTHEGYTASDFIWASKSGVEASPSPVSLIFSHRMSKAIVKLEKGVGYEGEIPADCKVFIHSTVASASIDLSTGDVSKDIYAGSTTIQAFKKDNTVYEAIVVPQNIESRRPLVEVVADGVSYMMEGKISFRQGYSHTLVVTLSKNPEQTKIEIGGSIGTWE